MERRLSAGLSAAALALALLAGCASPRAPHAPAEAAPPDTVHEAYAASVGALMWPGATRAFEVTPAGDLANGAWVLRVAPREGTAAVAPPRAIAAEDRWRPVLHWTRYGATTRWDFEAVAIGLPEPGPFSRGGAVSRWLAARDRERDRAAEAAALGSWPERRLDSLLLRAPHPLERLPVDQRGLVVSLQVTVTRTGAGDAPAVLELAFAPPDTGDAFTAPDAGAPPRRAEAWRARTAHDSVLGLAEGGVHGASLTRTWTLAPGGHAVLRTLLPAYPMRASALEALARTPHAALAERARAYWTREVARGATFALPDSELVRAIRAARVTLLALRERRDRDWVPVGGPFHYRDVWLRDGARATAALAVSGYAREAAELARGLERFQWPHGPFVSQVGQLDGTGQALWALAQVALRGGDADARAHAANAALRGWRALERLRGAGEPAGGPYARLLPVTDPHDGELVRAQLVGNDAWAIAGGRWTARLLASCGRAAAAESVSREADAYADAFRAALVATGRADLPPSWQGAGIDWGNLNAGWPCAVLPPGDSHLAALAERYARTAGAPGRGFWGDPDSAHTYVAADLGTWALLAGKRALAEATLDELLAWRNAGGGAAEMFSRSRRDFGHNLPPHATSAAALVTLARNMLVFDDADTLQLTLGARASWWRGARVSAAPTRWGAVDLAFSRTETRATWRWTAVPVWTALTLPPGCEAGAPLPPELTPGPRPDQVLAPPGSTAATVALRPARARAAATSASSTTASATRWAIP